MSNWNALFASPGQVAPAPAVNSAVKNGSSSSGVPQTGYAKTPALATRRVDMTSDGISVSSTAKKLPSHVPPTLSGDDSPSLPMRPTAGNAPTVERGRSAGAKGYARNSSAAVSPAPAMPVPPSQTGDRSQSRGRGEGEAPPSRVTSFLAGGGPLPNLTAASRALAIGAQAGREVVGVAVAAGATVAAVGAAAARRAARSLSRGRGLKSSGAVAPHDGSDVLEGAQDENGVSEGAVRAGLARARARAEAKKHALRRGRSEGEREGGAPDRPARLFHGLAQAVGKLVEAAAEAARLPEYEFSSDSENEKERGKGKDKGRGSRAVSSSEGEEEEEVEEEEGGEEEQAAAGEKHRVAAGGTGLLAAPSTPAPLPAPPSVPVPAPVPAPLLPPSHSSSLPQAGSGASAKRVRIAGGEGQRYTIDPTLAARVQREAEAEEEARIRRIEQGQENRRLRERAMAEAALAAANGTAAPMGKKKGKGVRGGGGGGGSDSAGVSVFAPSWASASSASGSTATSTTLKKQAPERGKAKGDEAEARSTELSEAELRTLSRGGSVHGPGAGGQDTSSTTAGAAAAAARLLHPLAIRRLCSDCAAVGPEAWPVLLSAAAHGHPVCVRAALYTHTELGGEMDKHAATAAAAAQQGGQEGGGQPVASGMPVGQNVKGAFRYAPNKSVAQVAPEPGLHSGVGGAAQGYGYGALAGAGGQAAGKGRAGGHNSAPSALERAEHASALLGARVEGEPAYEGWSLLHVAAAGAARYTQAAHAPAQQAAGGGSAHADVAATIMALLEAGCPITCTDAYGRMPVHTAAEWDHPAALLALLDAEWDCLEVPTASVERYRPLHACARAGATHAMLALIQSAASVGGTDANGRTPLHLAASAHAVRMLVENGADMRAYDAHGWQPVHMAAGYASSVDTLVSLLELENEGAGVKGSARGRATKKGGTSESSLGLLWALTRDGTGRTPLHIAAAAGNSDTLAVLLLAGASASEKDAAGHTPAQVAAQAGQDRAAALLQAASKHSNRPGSAARAAGRALLSAATDTHRQGLLGAGGAEGAHGSTGVGTGSEHASSSTGTVGSGLGTVVGKVALAVAETAKGRGGAESSRTAPSTARSRSPAPGSSAPGTAATQAYPSTSSSSFASGGSHGLQPGQVEAVLLGVATGGGLKTSWEPLQSLAAAGEIGRLAAAAAAAAADGGSSRAPIPLAASPSSAHALDQEGHQDLDSTDPVTGHRRGSLATFKDWQAVTEGRGQAELGAIVREEADLHAQKRLQETLAQAAEQQMTARGTARGGGASESSPERLLPPVSSPPPTSRLLLQPLEPVGSRSRAGSRAPSRGPTPPPLLPPPVLSPPAAAAAEAVPPAVEEKASAHVPVAGVSGGQGKEEGGQEEGRVAWQPAQARTSQQQLQQLFDPSSSAPDPGLASAVAHLADSSSALMQTHIHHPGGDTAVPVPSPPAPAPAPPPHPLRPQDSSASLGLGVEAMLAQIESELGLDKGGAGEGAPTQDPMALRYTSLTRKLNLEEEEEEEEGEGQGEGHRVPSAAPHPTAVVPGSTAIPPNPQRSISRGSATAYSAGAVLTSPARRLPVPAQPVPSAAPAVLLGRPLASAGASILQEAAGGLHAHAHTPTGPSGKSKEEVPGPPPTASRGRGGGGGGGGVHYGSLSSSAALVGPTMPSYTSLPMPAHGGGGGLVLAAPRGPRGDEHEGSPAAAAAVQQQHEEGYYAGLGPMVGRRVKRRLVQDYGAMVQAYTAQEPYRQAGKGLARMSCVLCHEAVVRRVFLPCEHASVCDDCIVEKGIGPLAPRPGAGAGAVPGGISGGSWDMCPVCLGQILAVVPVGSTTDSILARKLEQALVEAQQHPSSGGGAGPAGSGGVEPRFRQLFQRSGKALGDWKAQAAARKRLGAAPPGPATVSELVRAGWARGDWGPESSLAAYRRAVALHGAHSTQGIDAARALLASEPGGAWYSDFEEDEEEDEEQGRAGGGEEKEED